MEYIKTLINSSWFQSILGIFIGALITYWVSKHYYIESGEQLTKEIEQLRRTRRRQLLFDIKKNLSFVKQLSMEKDNLSLLIESDIKPRIAELSDICTPSSIQKIIQIVTEIQTNCEKPEITKEEIWEVVERLIIITNKARDMF